MAAKRIVERVMQPFAGAAVDREKGIIRNVKLCGLVSENHRDYLPEAFRRDHRKYDQRPIYANHSEERLVNDKMGWIESPHVDPDGTPRGDAHFLKTHPLYEQVMEAAERNPSLLGFSHVAMCHTSLRDDGRECVEGIERIESCDLVAEPATTQGLFESKGSRVFKIKQLVVWVAKHPKSTVEQIAKIKKLAEDDMYADADLGGAGEAGPAEDVDPDEAISSGFEAALMAVVRKALSGDMDPEAALQKIQTLLAAHGDATDGVDCGDEPSSEGKNKPTPGDDSTAVMEALDVCDRLGFRPDRVDLDLIAAAPKARREAVVQMLRRLSAADVGEKPQSASAHDTRRQEGQLKEDAAKIPTEAKKFAEWIAE